MALKRILSVFLLISLTLTALCSCGIIILRDPYATEGTAALPETDVPGPGSPPGKHPSAEDPTHQYTSIDYTSVIKQHIKSIDTVVYDSLGFFISAPAAASTRIEGSDESVLSKAVHNRNQLVEKTLGVRLFFQYTDSAGMMEELKNAESSGFFYTDLLMFPSSDTGVFVNSGSLLNLRSVLYLDLTADYFNASSVNASSAGIHTYTVAGAATLDPDSLPALYFDRKLFDDADLPSPYDQVYDGEWTWDALLFATTFLSDEMRTVILTNDGGNRTVQALYTSLGGQAVRCGIKEAPLLSLSDTSVDLLKKLGDALAMTVPYTPEADTSPSAAELFFDGGASVFFLDTLKESAFHATSSTQWGLLPIPKMTDTQTAYMTPVASDALLFAVPRTTGELAATGRVLSVLNAASYGVFIGLEADRRLETAFRDNDSAAMFVKIAESATYDFLDILGALDPSLSTEAYSILAEGAALPTDFPSSLQTRLNDLINKFTLLFPTS